MPDPIATPDHPDIQRSYEHHRHPGTAALIRRVDGTFHWADESLECGMDEHTLEQWLAKGILKEMS